MTGGYYILDDRGEPVPATVMGWAEWMRTGNRHVGNDMVGDVRVSTVFLGVDHAFGGGPPVLWETLVFGGPLDDEGERYTSRAAAMLGHSKWLRKVMESQP